MVICVIASINMFYSHHQDFRIIDSALHPIIQILNKLAESNKNRQN